MGPVGFFVVTMVSGPEWDPAGGPRQQRGWDQHAAFMDGLVERGFVVLGGPLGDAVDPVAMLVVDATSAGEVTAQLAADPWKAMGILHVGSITPWTIWLDGRRAGG